VVIKKLAGKVTRRASAGKKSAVSGKSTLKNLSTEELHALIEKKAYELFMTRGYSHGSDLSDWYQAEKLVQKSIKQ
jgi:hypothetical protein